MNSQLELIVEGIVAIGVILLMIFCIRILIGWV